jgi:hypothetical protein
VMLDITLSLCSMYAYLYVYVSMYVRMGNVCIFIDLCMYGYSYACIHVIMFSHGHTYACELYILSYAYINARHLYA